MHLGRRRKCARRQSEKLLYITVHLDRDREQSVVARAGAGTHAVGHFALHHQHRPVEHRVMRGQTMQDRRGDVVGKITDDCDRTVDLRNRRGKVELENILLDDSQFVLWKFLAYPCGQLSIQFDCDHVVCARHQGSCYSAAAWSNLDNGCAGTISKRSGNAPDCFRIVKEILTELRLFRHRHSRW